MARTMKSDIITVAGMCMVLRSVPSPSFSDPVEVLMFALLLASAGSLLARLRRARGVERQQIKWFAYAACVLALGDNLLYVVSDWLGAWWLPQEVGFAATVVGLAGLPVALSVAVLRYHLHDIDLIVSTTLVYGILTAVLAGVFEVSVVAMQHVLLVFAHQEESELAYFATALVMAAVFEPLKRRIDAFVERRCFRRGNEAAGPPEVAGDGAADRLHIRPLDPPSARQALRRSSHQSARATWSGSRPPSRTSSSSTGKPSLQSVLPALTAIRQTLRLAP
jgi:hypothetical protein